MPASRQGNTRKRDSKVDFDALGLELGNRPPQALDVEEAVLGAMLLEPNAVDIALGELTAECFYDPKHRTIFEAMTALVKDHTSVDIVTVANELRNTGRLEEVGGPVVLAGLSQKVGSAANIEFYCKVLTQKNIQRALISASYKTLHDAYDDSVNVDDLLDNASSAVFEIVQNNVKGNYQDIKSVINEAMSVLQKAQSETGLHGVPSGFESIDAVTGGWQPSDLIILAARPSVGKTAFSLNMARNAAVDHHIPVAIFSLEMASVQLGQRMMVTETGLPADKIKGNTKLEPFEWQQIETRLKRLTEAPLYIDETPGLPLMEFRTKAKNFVKEKGVRLIIVDYLQLMQGPPELKGMREQEVAAISRALKATAKELKITIIALSQLSRQAVTRQGGGGRPMLSDLRESGSIEQDADMVVFIHRPDFVGMSENPEDKEKTQIIIAKHRNGATCDIDMLFKSEQIKFVELNDSLVSLAGMTGSVDSAMNSMSPLDDYGALDSSMGGNEFQ